MMKRILTIVALIFLLLPQSTFAATYPHCTPYDGGSSNRGLVCTEAACGPFMCGISIACSDRGDCTTGDIVQVFGNIGNFVTAIVAALVFLMYIIGGINLMTAGGSSEKIAKGKKYITTSTLGLVIVLVAFAGIRTLVSALQTGNLSTGAYVQCAPDGSTDGEPCDLNSKCVGEVCMSECLIDHPEPLFSADQTIWYACVDETTVVTPPDVTKGACVSDQCPGAANIRCCQFIQQK